MCARDRDRGVASDRMVEPFLCSLLICAPSLPPLLVPPSPCQSQEEPDLDFGCFSVFNVPPAPSPGPSGAAAAHEASGEPQEEEEGGAGRGPLSELALVQIDMGEFEGPLSRSLLLSFTHTRTHACTFSPTVSSDSRLSLAHANTSSSMLGFSPSPSREHTLCPHFLCRAAGMRNGPRSAVHLALRQSEVLTLRDVRGGDPVRLALLTGEMGVKLLGRPGHDRELEAVLAAVAAGRGRAVEELRARGVEAAEEEGQHAPEA
jgi:hypothetical protein